MAEVRQVFLICREGRAEDSLCLSVSFRGLPGCHMVCLCVPLAYLGTLSRVPCGMLRWCCAGGNRAHQLAETSVVVAGMRWMERISGPARGEWKRRIKGNERRKPRGKKAKEGWVASKGRSGGGGGQGIVSSPWVSINSCLGVGLCALCFSSYCLGIPVGTLPAPMLRSRHHPNRSDQRQRGTSAG